MLPSALLLLLASGATAHTTLFSEAMFGWNPSDADFTKGAITPLRQRENLTIAKWFHRYLDHPPAAGKFLDIPSGGVGTYEVSCDPRRTSLWKPAPQTLEHRACVEWEWGALHNANPYNAAKIDLSVTGGTAISIAYTSDFANLKPEDLTVISVNYTSVIDRETKYAFPKGLPPCPAGGCICGWHWVHGKQHKEGYGDEMYFNAYRCQVSGQTDVNNRVGKGKPAVKCDTDPSKCTQGPMQPMYLFQKEGNNMPPPARGDDNPFYHANYGWKDGAQNQALVKAKSRRCK